MVLVGLTGGIASGKSTVSRFLQEEGAFIVDADQICHELIRTGNKAYKEVISTFGTQIIKPDGEINRKKLGGIVFRDAQQRERLNKILHPLVFEQLHAEKKRIASEHPQSVLIFDAPLLIESKAHECMDWVLLVYLDAKTQYERLIKQGKLTSDEAALRIAAQMPIDEKRAFADTVIDNSRSLKEVQLEVRTIYQQLLGKT